MEFREVWNLQTLSCDGQTSHPVGSRNTPKFFHAMKTGDNWLSDATLDRLKHRLYNYNYCNSQNHNHNNIKHLLQSFDFPLQTV